MGFLDQFRDILRHIIDTLDAAPVPAIQIYERSAVATLTKEKGLERGGEGTQLVRHGHTPYM